MTNFNPFGVSMPAGSARDLRVADVRAPHGPHAAHAAAGPAAVGTAEHGKRRTAAAATDASVDRGIV
jgi:hypothetical protein